MTIWQMHCLGRSKAARSQTRSGTGLARAPAPTGRCSQTACGARASSLSSFTWDALRDGRALALAKKVTVREDPAMSARLPLERPSRVTLFLRDGSTRVGEAGVNRGDDASPYTREELRTKFMDLTARIWPQAHAKELLEATLALAQLEMPMAPWLALLARAPQAA